MAPLEPGEIIKSLIAQAKRRGIVVDEDMPIVAFLQALDPTPRVSHRLTLAAGAVMAEVFRHERELASSGAPDSERHSTDCSF